MCVRHLSFSAFKLNSWHNRGYTELFICQQSTNKHKRNRISRNKHCTICDCSLAVFFDFGIKALFSFSFLK